MSTHRNAPTHHAHPGPCGTAPVVEVDPDGRWVAVAFDGHGPWHILDSHGRVSRRFTLPPAGAQPTLPGPDPVGGGEAA